MTQPLIVTFTIQQSDHILERGALLSEVRIAVEHFSEAMKSHKPEMTVTEGAPVRTRKKRAANGGTSPARTPGEAFFGKGPDGAG